MLYDFEDDINYEMREYEMAMLPKCKNNEIGEHCYQCGHCKTQGGYHGRTNLVCDITGDVIWEE